MSDRTDGAPELAVTERILREVVQDERLPLLTGRRQAELDKAVSAIGKNVRAIQGDVSKLDDLDRTIATIQADKGRLDVVFANAGTGELAPLGAITKEHYDRIFGVNVVGTLFTVQKALPLMRAGGSIIITGSTTGSMGTPAFSIYSVTKAAVRNFARSWALDLRGTGIRVNVLSPGPTETPGLDDLADAAGLMDRCALWSGPERARRRCPPRPSNVRDQTSERMVLATRNETDVIRSIVSPVLNVNQRRARSRGRLLRAEQRERQRPRRPAATD